MAFLGLAALSSPVRPQQEVNSLIGRPLDLLDEWVGPHPNFLPSVRCIEILALNNSTTLSLLMRELTAMDMSDRADTLMQQPDPEGKAAGCFKGHVTLWNRALARGCDETLVLEEE